VYDIVIDPGHGGSDNGAEYGGYAESDLTLEYGKKVKTELENLGLKVKITRDGTEDKETFGTQTVYNRDGRVNIVRTIKSKICIFNPFK
ncbi:MAG: N-acetylmuramoyl-L-alanine amidase, partial [Clostridia bacterium]|nr:N-acetylmuramoyl-L-alanine amidase [Clostridia bacterium]